MGFEYDCAGAIICPIQPPKFVINGQRTKARCIGCPHAAFCTTRNDVMARMDEIRQSITNETTKEWMAIRYITFHSVTMTTIISGQSPPYMTISRRMNLACLLQGCGIMASRKQNHTATTRSSSAVGWYIARKRIAKTQISMDDKNFSFVCCWTCQHCVLDVGVNKYICANTGQHLADKKHRYQVCKPTDCNMWNNKT